MSLVEQPRSRYHQVADQLRQAIERGDYEPGAALPSQPELARQYALNQTTINRAINVLRNEGLVRVEQGRGAYVADIRLARRLRRIPHTDPGGSTFATEVQKLGYEPRTELITVAVTDPAPDVQQQLRLPNGEQVLLRLRHMWASEVPVQIAASYIPISVAGDASIAEPDTGPTGMFERLAKRGHTPIRFLEDIEVRRPTNDEAAFLQLAEAQPVVVVRRTSYDQDDKAVETAINILAAYRWQLAYEWTADGPMRSA